MVKKTSKVFYEYNGEMMSVCDIYKKSKKRRGRSKYLLSVDVNVVKNNNVIPAKIVFVDEIPYSSSGKVDYVKLQNLN